MQRIISNALSYSQVTPEDFFCSEELTSIGLGEPAL